MALAHVEKMGCLEEAEMIFAVYTFDLTTQSEYRCLTDTLYASDILVAIGKARALYPRGPLDVRPVDASPPEQEPRLRQIFAGAPASKKLTAVGQRRFAAKVARVRRGLAPWDGMLCAGFDHDSAFEAADDRRHAFLAALRKNGSLSKTLASEHVPNATLAAWRRNCAWFRLRLHAVQDQLWRAGKGRKPHRQCGKITP